MACITQPHIWHACHASQQQHMAHSCHASHNHIWHAHTCAYHVMSCLTPFCCTTRVRMTTRSDGVAVGVAVVFCACVGVERSRSRERHVHDGRTKVTRIRGGDAHRLTRTQRTWTHHHAHMCGERQREEGERERRTSSQVRVQIIMRL